MIGRWAGVFARGFAMGIAEIVPGVSGGTIAFITGIYDELLRSLAGFSHRSIGVLRREGVAGFWRAHNLAFLVVLGLGMLTAVLACARLVRWLLEAYPLYVWGFFFGLIAGSVVNVGMRVPARWLASAGVAGVALGGLVGLFVRDNPDPAHVEFFFGGALAILAWMLPGVSGGFVLLLLGLYYPLLVAIADWRLDIVGATLGGIVLGVLAFSKLLAYVLSRWHAPVIAALVGFMAGSLLRLWPWRVGDAVVTPAGFEAMTGTAAALGGVVAVAVLGAITVALLALGARRTHR